MDTFVINVTIVPWFGWLCEHGGGVPKCVRFQSLFSTVRLTNCFFNSSAFIRSKFVCVCVCVCVTANTKSLPVHIRGIYLTVSLILSYLTASLSLTSRYFSNRLVLPQVSSLCTTYSSCGNALICSIEYCTVPRTKNYSECGNLYCIKHRVC